MAEASDIIIDIIAKKDQQINAWRNNLVGLIKHSLAHKIISLDKQNNVVYLDGAGRPTAGNQPYVPAPVAPAGADKPTIPAPAKRGPKPAQTQ